MESNQTKNPVDPVNPVKKPGDFGQDLQNRQDQELDRSNHPVDPVNPVKKLGGFGQDLQNQQDQGLDRSNHPVDPVNPVKKSEEFEQDIEELTRQVIGAAYAVYNVLKFGFLESVYEKSLTIELRKLNLIADTQRPIQVFYDGHVVGDFLADILVDNRLIIELKSVQSLHVAHEVQLVNYLNATGIDDGLLINFGPKRVDIKRKYRQHKAKNPVDPVNPVKKSGMI